MGIADITVYLLDENNTNLAKTLSDADGQYTFDNIGSNAAYSVTHLMSTSTLCYQPDTIPVIIDVQAPEFTINSTGSLCDPLGVVLTPSDDNYDFNWLVGGSFYQSIYAAGNHLVEATDPINGCTSTASYEILPIGGECNILEGNLSRTMDCTTAQSPLANWLIEITGDNYLEYRYTDANGGFSLPMPQGEYLIRPILISPAWSSCEEEGYVINFNGYGETQSLQLLALAQEDCPLLEISVSMNNMRPCFEDRSVYIHYTNIGTDTLSNGFIAVLLPEALTYASTSTHTGDHYLGMSGDTLLFAPPSALAPGEGSNFRIYVDVACDTEVGSTLCVRALGLPYGPCPTADMAWSGASLRAEGRCEEEEVILTLRNVGNAPNSDGITYIIIQDQIMAIEAPEEVPVLNPGESTSFNFDANGSTYRLESMQEPFHPGFSMPTAVVEGCGTNEDGAFSMGFVTQFPNDDADFHVDEDCRIVTAAYDPNDKQAEPLGYAEEHYVEPDQALEYTIRFQNTGTDTAFTVIVRDTLSQWLDMCTFRPGSSSHNYRVELDSARQIAFVFDNILLPDSTTNLEASQGFVQFQIEPVDTVPLKTRVENTAAIYFDFNAPIFTNTTFHTLGRYFIEMANWVANESNDIEWQLFPNPTSGLLNIRWSAPLETAQLRLYDPMGRLVNTYDLAGGEQAIDLKLLAPGWYTVQLLSSSGNLLGNGKLIRR